MKKSIARVAALMALQGAALFAQSLVGTWQGLMLVSQTPGDTLHVVFKISTSVGGALTGQMYSIDQGGQAPTPDVTLKGSTVKIVMPSIGATYTGNLNGDGNSIAGKWASSSGGGTPLTLNLTRATAETAVSNLILIAYGIHARQLIGAPAWIEKDRYDIIGKPDVEGQPNNRQMRALFQKLLADRFGMKSHHEKRELSVYTIVAAKSGAKLTASEEDPKGDPTMFFYGPGKFVAKNATMAEFAGLLQQGVLDRPVVDQTGLAGRYDFGLVFRPDQPLLGGGRGDNPPAPSDQDALQDVYGAVQQQLGLRLDATKTQIDVMVVDQLEKPSGN